MYPKKKLYILEYGFSFKGYTCDKAPGMSLDNLIEEIKMGKCDILFDEFLKGYYDYFLPNLKQENVILGDVRLRHIFYDKKFTLIDSDLYEQTPSFISKNEKDKFNNIEINNYLNLFILSFYAKSPNFFNGCSYSDEGFLADRISQIQKVTNVDSFGSLLQYNKSNLKI